MTRRIGVLVFLLTLVITGTMSGQSANTSLRGTVKDPTGAVLPGATITLVNQAAGQTLTATSDGSGEYQLSQVPPAKYTITAAASGFGNLTKTAELLVNQPATINFALTVTANNEVMDVSASAQTLNTTDASLGDAKDNALIQALPSEERNVAELLALQPGVFSFPAPSSNPALADSRIGAVNGGRSDQSNVTLDGVDDNDQVRGLAFTGVLRETQDSVEEFRVTTGGSNADAGRSSGAQISLVTKSGTNKFHGAAYEYYRPTNTVSNDYFIKQSELQSGLPNRPGKLLRNIFGGDLGGPIVKDKLFFFANYEGLRRAESATVTEVTPTLSYQQGTIKYVADNAAGGMETDSLTTAQVKTLDGGCQVCNTAAYAPGPGPNPNALAYFKSLPTANSTNPGSSGDGLNEAEYVFSSPNPYHTNTTIVRLDYIPSSKHRIFARGNLQKDTTGSVEQFPGQGPSSSLVDNTKGMTFGDTWTISSSMVNDIRYGYVRQGYGRSGAGTGDYVDFRFISSPTSEARSTIASVPVNNIVDNFNWTKGKHNFEFGGNWRLVHQNRSSNSNSFNGASTNPYWLKGNAPQPDSIGLNPVDGSFTNSYNIAFANLIGTVPSVTLQSNYALTSATSGTLLADGAPIARHFAANEFEVYAQDAWRPLPNLTITYGVRWTILQTPYETKGQEVTPTIDTHAWFTQREASALKGVVYEPDLTFAPAGKFYSKPGFYPKQKDNFAPRLAVAYSPNSKTSIRAGAGIYFDHFGEGLVNTFDQNGAFGISSAVTNPAGIQSYSNSPRYTARNALPKGINTTTFPSTTAFPYLAPQGNFAITWGLDDHLKTPYTESFDLSIQRELGKGFSFEAAYVGRLGRHLLQQLDLAEPVDFVDPQGGGDYYTAGAKLSALSDQHGGDPTATVQAIPYFEHVFPFMANVDFPGESATQAIYSDEWAPYRYSYGETTSLADIDFYCVYGCPAGYQSKFWQDQFSSLYALSTIGMSYYNAAQLTLRHSGHGLQLDVNYTYSKSIDFGSDAERTSEFSNGVAGANSEIANTWKPYLNKAASDFDTRHLLTADYAYQLPFGRGKAFLGSTNYVVDALVGGWQLSGIFKATSGLPFSFFEPGWSTDWQIESYGVNVGNVKAHKHRDAAGDVLYFDNASAINSGVYNGSPIRLPYAGEAGQRNNFRGDGYLDLDSGLSKSWKIADLGALKFAWEVYNVTNTNRFDPFSIGSGLTGASLGTASTLLTIPRRMQFGLRYDF